MLHTCRTSGQQGECIDVVWSDDREMSPVECGDRSLVESFGGSYYGCVDRPQWQIAVLMDELGDAEPVGRSDRFDSQVAACEVAQEANLGVGAEPSPDEIDDLGDHQRRYNEWLGVVEKECEAGFMMAIVGVDIGVKRASIDYECDCETSLARISSMRSEMSERPLRPAPAAPSLRRGAR